MSLVGSTSLVRVKFIGIFANFAHTAEPDFVMKREKWEKNKNRDLKNSVVIAFFPISIKNILNLSQFILCLWYNFLQPFIRLPATITCNYPPPPIDWRFFSSFYLLQMFSIVLSDQNSLFVVLYLLYRFQVVTLGPSFFINIICVCFRLCKHFELDLLLLFVFFFFSFVRVVRGKFNLKYTRSPPHCSNSKQIFRV